MEGKKSRLLISALFLFLFFLPQSSYASSGYDFPLGPPEGASYAVTGTGGLNWLDRYDYSQDGIPEYHPGEDWNKKIGEDYGDPVYSISPGVIKYASFNSANWGYLVLIEHDLSGGKYWSQYGHMKGLANNIVVGKKVEKSDVLGYVGAYPFGSGRNIHLHFEIRKKYREAFDFVMNWTKTQVEEYYVYPTQFISSHRPLAPSALSLNAGENGGVNLTWTKSNNLTFDKYELYRSNTKDGTFNPVKRTLISTVTSIDALSFVDYPSPGDNYYRIYNYSKSGLVAYSEEVNISIERKYTNITTDPDPQQYPSIDGNIVTWQDNRIKPPGSPFRIYYYDLGENKIKDIDIDINKLRSGALYPFIKGKHVIFSVQDETYNSTKTNIYVVNLKDGKASLITNGPKDQLAPVISDTGIAVWNDLRNGNTDIYYKDMNKDEGEKLLVGGAGNQRNPRIWGNKVVWKDSRVGNRHDLYYKEVGTEAEVLLAKNVGDSTPDIWEDWVVWEYKGKISLINLKTNEIKEIVASNASPVVRVRDGKVIYSILSETNYYIHIYDLNNGNTTKLDLPVKNVPFVAISGNNIVFDMLQEESINNLDIFLTRI